MCLSECGDGLMDCMCALSCCDNVIVCVCCRELFPCVSYHMYVLGCVCSYCFVFDELCHNELCVYYVCLL